MKQKITILFSVFFILISLYKVTTSHVTEGAGINTASISDSFIIGATDNAWQGNNDTLVSRLKHNVWHKYGTYPNGWRYQGAPGDSLYADSIHYYQQVKGIINNNASENISTTMDRGKISLLAWSQSSDYQCEETLADNDYWFYKYSTHSNVNMQDVTDSQYGNGEKVRYCYPHPQGPQAGQGWVVKDLIANREQINRDWVYELNDSVGKWYVKPRIRIDSVYANDPGNFNKEVCKIIVLNFNGDTIKQKILKVNNFIPDNSNYNGDYLENFHPLNDTGLILSNGSVFNPDRKSIGDMSCQVDFRIWYYGNCDMWIDRVKVQNEVANDLLSNDTNNTNYIRYDNWLHWECNLAMENPDNVWDFYMEEFEFNNTPSIAYVNKKIKEYTGGRFSLMVNLNYELYKVHLPYHWTHNFSAEKLNKYLFEPAELQTLWNVAYVLEGWTRADSASFGGIPNYHPNTLSNLDYDPSAGILSYKTTPAAYDNWLQVHFDQGPASAIYINQMKLADTVSRVYGQKVINLLQTHMWHITTHKLKEPSNEELEMINMLPVTYGIKGIIYFTYSSVGNIGDNFYYRGIIEPGKNPITPRDTNVYGQKKWNKLKEIATKLKKWGPYIMSFDDASRKSYIYRLFDERTNLINQTFFNDILSYKPVESDFPGHQTNPESVSQRYLQAAKFNNPDEQFTRYFMIVNRRCSPFDYLNPDIESGIRFIQIKLDSNANDFSGFNNWSIYDLENDSLIKTFNKKVISTIDLGWYLPGEGKLYKISPVMQEGGELVADEVITGGSFNCNSDVFSTGNNIKINPNTTVNFADGVKWNFTAGEFICGSMGDNPVPLPVTLTSQSTPSRAYWKGIMLNQCYNVEIENTVMSYLDNSTTALQLIDCIEFNINHNTFNLTDL